MEKKMVKVNGFAGYVSEVKEVANLPRAVRMSVEVDGVEREIFFGYSRFGGGQTYTVKNGKPVRYTAKQLATYFKAINVVNLKDVKEALGRLVVLKTKEDKKTGRKHDMVQCSHEGCSNLVNAANIDWVQRMHDKMEVNVGEFATLCLDHQPKLKARNGVPANKDNKKAKAHNVEKAKCEACGKEVSTSVASYSNQKFGKVLCYGKDGCQTKYKKNDNIKQDISCDSCGVSNTDGAPTSKNNTELGTLCHDCYYTKQESAERSEAQQPQADNAEVKMSNTINLDITKEEREVLSNLCILELPKNTKKEVKELVSKAQAILKKRNVFLTNDNHTCPESTKKEEGSPSEEEVVTAPASEASGNATPQVEEAPASAPQSDVETKEAPQSITEAIAADIDEAKNLPEEEQQLELSPDDEFWNDDEEIGSAVCLGECRHCEWDDAIDSSDGVTMIYVSGPDAGRCMGYRHMADGSEISTQAERAESSTVGEECSTGSIDVAVCNNEECDETVAKGQDLCPTCYREAMLKDM